MLTKSAARYVRQQLPDCNSDRTLALKATALMHECDLILAKVKAANKRMKAIPRAKAPGVSKEERREERNARAAEIRAAVMARADGRCEWCARDGFVLEWAHVIDGNGSRQAHESVETTAAVCADCHHRGWHGKGPRRERTLNDAKEWALRLGFREALAAIEKKIAKHEEAARVAPF